MQDSLHSSESRKTIEANCHINFYYCLYRIN